MEAIAWVLGIGIALYFLFRFTKPMLILVSVLFAVAVVVGLGAWVYNEVIQARKREIDVSASFAAAQVCSPAFPVLISIHNKSVRPVEKTGLYLRAKRPGYSDVVYSSYITNDKIISPGTTFASCWALDEFGRPAAPENLQWFVEVYSVDFGA